MDVQQAKKMGREGTTCCMAVYPASLNSVEYRVIPPCDPTADDKLFHICISAVSLAVLLILIVLARQRNPSHRKGVADLFSPVNFLDQTQPKGLTVAVLVILFCKLSVVVLSPNPLPFIQDPAFGYRECWKILALFYYPALYYPLLACGTLRNTVACVLGSLLSWAHLGVLVWQKVDCPRTPEIYKFYTLLASLPQIVCLVFLSLHYPLLLLKSRTEANGAVEGLASSYYKDYVKKILKKTPSKVSTAKPKLSKRLSDTLNAYIYTPEEVFRIPILLAASVFLSFIAIYQMTLLLVTMVLPTLHIVREGVDEDIAFLLAGFDIHLSDDRAEVVKIVVHYIWCVEVCYLSALTLTCLISLVMLMRSMVLHRSNLKALYRGDVCPHISNHVHGHQRGLQPSRPALVCWMGYTSYHAAFICIGMVIQMIVFFMCILFAAFLLIIPILHGQNLILFNMLKRTWPYWLTFFLALAVPHVTARLAFIKRDAGTRDLVNRNALFLLTYLLFLVNVLVGMVLGAWRMVVSALYNIVHLGRMDISLLNRGVEPFDPGYSCYVQYLRIEVSQSHPVMTAFCGMLLQSVRKDCGAVKKCDAEEGIHLVGQEKWRTRSLSARRAKARWLLLLTLLNNPSLLGSRKPLHRPGSAGQLNGMLSHATLATEANGKDGGKDPETPPTV
ncbi:receptor for retinol uptake stra6-like [Conger conger]|uniref:receptor for retinol uptake stra6-like n=1 Tax=Conger conger TaxID=82655 RepID=UPI002A5997B0|nr:receptor for retinol uptake stra6-like [Conger conger]